MDVDGALVVATLDGSKLGVNEMVGCKVGV